MTATLTMSIERFFAECATWENFSKWINGQPPTRRMQRRHECLCPIAVFLTEFFALDVKVHCHRIEINRITYRTPDWVKTFVTHWDVTTWDYASKEKPDIEETVADVRDLVRDLALLNPTMRLTEYRLT